MADATELKCWPACRQAIDWSPDGIIALASDERVELLFPSADAFESEFDVAQWRHLPVQVPWFTTDELPVKTPGPQRTYSIGEEISASAAVEIAWSPPGIAKHRRCALAALTTNLVLSIWSSDGKVQEEGSWGRRLIVNDSLEDYFSDIAADVPSSITNDDVEKLRLRRRIRTFSWAPSMPVLDSFTTNTVGTQTFWGQHLMATANDDNQVIIVALNSPASTNGVESAWSADVLGFFSIGPLGPNVQEPYLFEDIIDQQRHAAHLAWSPWCTQSTSATSILACATNREVRTRAITYLDGNTSIGEEVVFEGIETRYAGLLRWMPKIGRDGSLRLACFTMSEIICLSFSAADGSFLERTSFPRGEQLETFSGATWDLNGNENPRIHFADQSMNTRTSLSALQLSTEGFNTVDIEGWPYWKDQITNSITQFSTSHDLRGNATARIWGLSVSPLGDFMASCYTVHPTDMIEYGTPHDRRCTVALSHLWGKGAPFRFPKGNVSAEGVFISVRRWIDHNVESAVDLPTVQEEIWKKLVQAYGLTDSDVAATQAERDLRSSRDIINLIAELKQQIFLDPKTLEDRFEILAWTICIPSESRELPRTMIAYRNALHIQSTDASTYKTHDFSNDIVNCSRQIVLLIQSLISEDDSAMMEPSQPCFTETCTFCDAEIHVKDIVTATCKNGHEFQRCGLTFLSIQQPGSAKYCGICDTPFLSEEHVANEIEGKASSIGGSARVSLDIEENALETTTEDFDMDVENEEQRQDQRPVDANDGVNLARLLFLACDVCVYCGGKFTG